LLLKQVSRLSEAMYSTINKKLSRAVIALAVALVGVHSPAGAFAASSGLTSTLYASAARPVLAIPGNLIIATVGNAVTDLVLNGPKVPQISAEALPATFYFTFTQKKGSTIIDIRDFGILDGNAALIRPVHFDDGTTKVVLHAGQSKKFTLTEVMGIGTGTMRWAPLNHYVVDWQFVAETA